MNGHGEGLQDMTSPKRKRYWPGYDVAGARDGAFSYGSPRQSSTLPDIRHYLHSQNNLPLPIPRPNIRDSHNLLLLSLLATLLEWHPSFVRQRGDGVLECEE